MKDKELEIKEAQGRKSREIGRTNLIKLLTHLHYNPSTFTQLEKFNLFSKPVLMKHLKNLREEGLIQRKLENDKIIYYTTPRALEESVSYIVNLIREISPEDFEYALNFMTNNLLYLMAQTQRIIEEELKNNPENQSLKEKRDKLQSLREELLPWLREL